MVKELILIERFGKLVALFLGFAVIQGCVTPLKSAFDETTTSLDLSKESVVIVNVDFYNQYKPTAQAKNLILVLEKPRIGEKPERLRFSSGEPEVIDNDHRASTIRGAVTPGKYKVKSVVGNSVRGISPGSFAIPIGQSIEIEPNSVIYLGSIKALNRKRKDGEFRSGSVIPLIDQSVNGYSGGTMDVEIVDDLDSIEATLKQKFPVLESVSITNQVLEPFDRSKWDKK